MAKPLFVLVLTAASTFCAAQSDLNSILRGAESKSDQAPVEAQLKDYVAKHPNSSVGWLNLAILQTNRKNLSDAEGSLNKVIALGQNGPAAEAKMRLALIKSGPRDDELAAILLAESLEFRDQGDLYHALTAAQQAKRQAKRRAWECDAVIAGYLVLFGKRQEAIASYKAAIEAAPKSARQDLESNLKRIQFQDYSDSIKQAALSAYSQKSANATQQLLHAWTLMPSDATVGLMLAGSALHDKNDILAEEVCQALGNLPNPEVRKESADISKSILDMRSAERDFKAGSAALIGSEQQLEEMAPDADPGTDIEDPVPVKSQSAPSKSGSSNEKDFAALLETDLQFANSKLASLLVREQTWANAVREIETNGGDPTDAKDRLDAARSLIKVTRRKIKLLEIGLKCYRPDTSKGAAGAKGQ